MITIDEDQARVLRAHQIEMSLRIGKLKSSEAKKAQVHLLVVSLKCLINGCGGREAGGLGAKVG